MKCWSVSICVVLYLVSSGCRDIGSETDQFRINSKPDSNMSAESEYIFVLGDLQEYTSDSQFMKYYDMTISWVNSQKDYFSAKGIIQTGDITAYNASFQWQNYFNSTISLSKELPIISCIGNHDYRWDDNNKIPSRDNTHYSLYTSLLASQLDIISFYETDRMENIVVEIEVNGIKFNIIVLEFGPRRTVIDWANDFLLRHDTENNIILTHEYLTNLGELVTNNITSEFQFSHDFSTPREIWEKLVAPHNVLCVLCGHNGFNSISFAENIRGSKVAQVLFNLQYQKNGGNGYIQIWEFPKDSRDVYMAVYDTVNREYITEKVYLFSY